MRQTFVLTALAFLTVAGISSCKKDPTAPSGNLEVSFANVAGGQPVSLGPIAYTNAAGNRYSVDMLKYYITNFTLVKADGTEKNFRNYELIDADVPASQSFTLKDVPNGEYTAVKFYVGVDSTRNRDATQEGDLDPAGSMVWTWNTGYIFFKHEGSYVDTAGQTKTLFFHFGTDVALAQVTVPLTKLNISGNNRKLYLKFDLNRLYSNPEMIDFNYDNNRMSTSRDDIFWINAMKRNFAQAFYYDKAE